MIQEHAAGEIKDILEDGTAVIHAALPDLDRAFLRDYGRVEIILPDGRQISPEQRRKVYALIGEVAEYVDGIRNAETVESARWSSCSPAWRAWSGGSSPLQDVT